MAWVYTHDTRYCNGMDLLHVDRVYLCLELFVVFSCLSVRNHRTLSVGKGPAGVLCVFDGASKWPWRRGEEQESYLGSIGICQQKKEICAKQRLSEGSTQQARSIQLMRMMSSNQCESSVNSLTQNCPSLSNIWWQSCPRSCLLTTLFMF